MNAEATEVLTQMLSTAKNFLEGNTPLEDNERLEFLFAPLRILFALKPLLTHCEQAIFRTYELCFFLLGSIIGGLAMELDAVINQASGLLRRLELKLGIIRCVPMRRG